MSTAIRGGTLRPVNGSASGWLDARRQFQHPDVTIVGDVEVAGGIHRHTEGAVEAGERQLRRGPSPAAASAPDCC